MPSRTIAKSTRPWLGDGSDGDSKTKPASPFKGAFVFDEFSEAVMAKIVKKYGQRDYWQNWAGDIAKIAQTHIG